MLVLGYRVRYWLRSGSILHDLKLSQQRVFKAQEIARLGHWELHLESGKFHISAQNPEQFGIEDVDDYTSLFQRIAPSEQHQVKQLIAEAQGAGKSFSLNYRIILPDGQERIIF